MSNLDDGGDRVTDFKALDQAQVSQMTYTVLTNTKMIPISFNFSIYALLCLKFTAKLTESVSHFYFRLSMPMN